MNPILRDPCAVILRRFKQEFKIRIAASLAFAVAFVVLAMTSASARAGIYGTNPLNIAVGPNGAAANAASGGPDISGDDRYARIVAFHSDASNLVRGDTNGQRDVFLWRRPKGFAGLALNRIGLGRLSPVSVSRDGHGANGPSQNPSVDGSMQSKPHCVAFQSRATNLADGDSSDDWDIYMRDLRRRRTLLISKGVSGDATDPSISGNCRRVAFTAGGSVWSARLGGKPHRVGGGSMPDYSLDGNSLAYRDSAGRIKFVHSGHSATFGTGTDPIVSDESAVGGWAVGFNHDGRVELGIVRRSGAKHTTTVTGRDAVLGGVSAYAANQGIVTYTVGSSLFYLNRHTGNSDDLAHADETIPEAAASARANFVVFTSTGGGGFIEPDGRGGGRRCKSFDPITYECADPPAAPPVAAIYVKQLVDGKAL